MPPGVGGVEALVEDRRRVVHGRLLTRQLLGDEKQRLSPVGQRETNS